MNALQAASASCVETKFENPRALRGETVLLMSEDRQDGKKLGSNGNGSVLRWAVGIIAMLAVAGATFANGAFWWLSSDVKANTALSVRNEERFLAIRDDIAEIKEYLRALSSQGLP